MSIANSTLPYHRRIEQNLLACQRTKGRGGPAWAKTDNPWIQNEKIGYYPSEVNRISETLYIKLARPVLLRCRPRAEWQRISTTQFFEYENEDDDEDEKSSTGNFGHLLLGICLKHLEETILVFADISTFCRDIGTPPGSYPWNPIPSITINILISVRYKFIHPIPLLVCFL